MELLESLTTTNKKGLELLIVLDRVGFKNSEELEVHMLEDLINTVCKENKHIQFLFNSEYYF